MDIPSTYFDFFLHILGMLTEFGTWLVSPLPLIDMSPLALFSIVGIVAILTFHLIRLVVGG